MNLCELSTGWNVNIESGLAFGQRFRIGDAPHKILSLGACFFQKLSQSRMVGNEQILSLSGMV